jgi:hypothetical protein
MVPGMTERERLAADARREAWLSEAKSGSVQLRPHNSPTRSVAGVRRDAAVEEPSWQRLVAAMRLLLVRVHAIRPSSTRYAPDHVGSRTP